MKYNTAVIGDLHLADAEPEDPTKKYWKNYKKKIHFFDDSFRDFLRYLVRESGSIPVELVLNGDIFDYDSVMRLPANPDFKITSVERQTGLGSEEGKSFFKTRVMLEEHAVFMSALKEFLALGNRVVFIIGNHDIELYWPSVQMLIKDTITENAEQAKEVIFCEWFYVSQQDTLIEHGHQYDPYSMCLDPINPIILRKRKYKIRVPFGDLANRFIVNRLGLKNPNDESSYVKTGVEFMKFFFKYELKTEPFMVFKWLFGALRTLKVCLQEGFTPAQKDPLTYESKIKGIAERSNTTTHAVFSLRNLHAHPAVYSPFKVIRELWLDRFFLLVLIIAGCWQVFTTVSLFAGTSIWVFIIPLLLGIPFIAYYSQGITSDVYNNLRAGEDKVPIAAKIVSVKRVVHGHTHHEKHIQVGEVEFLNPGSWSPFFDDVECTVDKRVKKYVWISQNGESRKAELLIWDG